MKVVFLLLVFAFGGPAWAKPALVKSGEHDDFSRLVLYTGDAQTWSQARSLNTVTIAISGWSSGFDTSQVFEMIPRDRITQLQSTEIGLEISLGCDCAIGIEAIANVGLLIDVIDERPSITFTPQTIRPTYFWPEPDGFIRQNETSSAITEFRKELTEGVGRAATQQALTTIPSSHFNAEEPSKPAVGTQDSEAVWSRIRTTSAMERAAGRQSSPESRAIACPPDYFGDIENWGSARPFAEQLGNLRIDLMDEFDALSGANALSLVKLYLYFAMGSEALATIDTLKLNGDEVQFLRPIATLLDGASTANTTLKFRTNGCEGTHAIWAALLGSDQETIREAQAKTITSSFSHLPHRLKSLLGPSLIVRLQHDGLEIAASVIRNAIANDPDNDAGTHPMKAALKTLPTAELNQMVAKSDSQTPLALVALLETAIAQSTPISAPLREVARSFAVQQNGDPVAVELKKLLAMNTILEGAYLKALETAFSFENRDDRLAVLTFAADHLIDQGSDLDVAKFALRIGRSDWQDSLKPEAISDIETRLLDAGLDKLASRFSRRPMTTGTSEAAGSPADEDLASDRLTVLPDIEAESPTLGTARTILGASTVTRQQILSMLSDSDLSATE